MHYILHLNNIFPNQLCIYSSQLTRHFQMNAISSEWPKFVNDIIQPHWKNCTCKWMLMLVNYPCNFCMLRHVLPIAFSYLGLHPIACQFLVNNLHFIMYSALTGQNPDRKQPNKEPIVLCPHKSLWNMNFFPLFSKFLPVGILSSVRSYWRSNRVLVRFPQQNYVTEYFWATSCNWILSLT